MQILTMEISYGIVPKQREKAQPGRIELHECKSNEKLQTVLSIITQGNIMCLCEC